MNKLININSNRLQLLVKVLTRRSPDDLVGRGDGLSPPTTPLSRLFVPQCWIQIDAGGINGIDMRCHRHAAQYCVKMPNYQFTPLYIRPNSPCKKPAKSVAK